MAEILENFMGFMPEWANRNIEEHRVEAVDEYEEQIKHRNDFNRFANTKNRKPSKILFFTSSFGYPAGMFTSCMGLRWRMQWSERSPFASDVAGSILRENFLNVTLAQCSTHVK